MVGGDHTGGSMSGGTYSVGAEVGCWEIHSVQLGGVQGRSGNLPPQPLTFGYSSRPGAAVVWLGWTRTTAWARATVADYSRAGTRGTAKGKLWGVEGKGVNRESSKEVGTGYRQQGGRRRG